MKESVLYKKIREACELAMPGCVIFKVFDNTTDGIPDMAVTWGGRTVWLEVKYADPEYEETELQRLVMSRLSRTGMAYYVVFKFEDGAAVQDTTRVLSGKGEQIVMRERFSHHFVAEFLREAIRAINSPGDRDA